jgi:hypothetical protein
MSVLLPVLGIALAASCLRLAIGFCYPRKKPDWEFRTTAGIALLLLLIVITPSVCFWLVHLLVMAVLDHPWHMG